jgi:hypothetical protein
MKATQTDERGVATVELGLMLGFLMLLALGAFEYGMLFAKSQDVASASREGARTAASAGSEPTADCLILEAASGALFGTTGGSVSEVVIEEANVGGTPPRQRYRPAVASDDPLLLACGNWYPIQTSWPPASRDDTGVTRDWVSVDVVYEHEWITDFLWFTGTESFSEVTTMHMPPNN